MKTLITACRLLLLMTVLTGLIYPLAILAIAQWTFPLQANGSLVRRGSEVVGSALLAQQFQSPRYFWPRPSAVQYNPLAGAGSNLGPISLALKQAVADRRSRLIQAHPGAGEWAPPAEMLFASGSGLDPHLRREAVYYQLQRVIAARKLDAEAATKVRELAEEALRPHYWTDLGSSCANVLLLNLALDHLEQTH